MSEGKNLKVKKARAWAADTQGPGQPAWEERGTPSRLVEEGEHKEGQSVLPT